MIERAGWRRGAGDPETPLGVYFGRERLLGLPVGGWLALYAALVLLAASHLSHDAGRIVWTAAFLPLTSGRKDYREPRMTGPRLGFRRTLALATTNPLALLSADRMDGVADLVPVPTPDLAYTVEITLRRGERITGGDLGVVVFADGWLVYEGRTTAFSLSPTDVRKGWPDLPAWTFQLPEGQGLTLRSHDEGWCEAVRDWLRSAPPAGLSRLPPLSPNPIRRMRVPAWFHLGAEVVAGGALSRLILKGGLRAALVLGAFALVLYVAGVLVARRRR